MRTPKKADQADYLVSEDCKTDYDTMKQKMESGEMKVVSDGGNKEFNGPKIVWGS